MMSKEQSIFFWKLTMICCLLALLTVALFHEYSSASKSVTIGLILWNVMWGLLALFQLDRLQKVEKDK